MRPPRREPGVLKGRQKPDIIVLTVAPSGLTPGATLLHQGLTPLAIDDRPFGAEDWDDAGAGIDRGAVPYLGVRCAAVAGLSERGWQVGTLPSEERHKYLVPHGVVPTTPACHAYPKLAGWQEDPAPP